MRLSDLQSKDIISTKDGKKIGRIIDAEFDPSEGIIRYLIIEEKPLIRNILGGNKETTVLFTQISKIGEDVILVDL